MPKARAQTPPKKAVKKTVNSTPASAAGRTATGGIRDRITPIAEHKPSGLKLNVYGRGKTGKTRLACTFPKPAMLAATEDGTKSVAKAAGVDYLRLYSASEVLELRDVIVEDGYETVILDQASGLQDMIMAEILGLAQMPIQKGWGIASREQWQAGASQTKERLWELLALSESHNKNVVIIAHERDFKGEGDSEFPTVGSALMPSVCNWLNGACDYICQTFIKDQTKKVQHEIAGDIVEFEEKTGKSDYCLRVGPHSVYMTGFRLPDGVELPDYIVNPNYDKIMELISQ